MEILPGSGGSGDAGTMFYLVKRAAAVTGHDLRNAGRRSTKTIAPRSASRSTPRRAEVRQGQRRERRPPARDHPRRPRAVAPTLESRITTDGRISAASRRTMQNLSLILRSARCRRRSLSRGADDRPVAQRGFHPLRREASIAGLVLIVVFMLITRRPA
jgi:preprotein translocase subunit SecD